MELEEREKAERRKKGKSSAGSATKVTFFMPQAMQRMLYLTLKCIIMHAKQ